MAGRSILIIINDPGFFLTHRLPVALAAQKAGYSVHIATAIGNAVQEIINYGFSHHAIPLSRSGLNPFVEIQSIWALWRLMRHIRPDIVHLVTIKPVLYGGIAARLAQVPGIVAAISGLGSVFVSKKRNSLTLYLIVEFLYKIALNHKNIKVIFQNPDDRVVLCEIGAVQPEQAVIIKGSGVALPSYPMLPEREDVPVVTFASRLLKEKGVSDFVDAVKLLKERGIDARFWLVGSQDPGNPATVTDRELETWRREGIVELLGYRPDIAKLFSKSNIVVLPSYYGEGLPKVLIEAAASGRAIVTTDHPGCRDAIEPDKTGLLVPVRDCVALADAIERLIKDKELRQQMGKAGRELAVREFSIDRVVEAHMNVYQEILDRMS